MHCMRGRLCIVQITFNSQYENNYTSDKIQYTPCLKKLPQIGRQGVNLLSRNSSRSNGRWRMTLKTVP